MVWDSMVRIAICDDEEKSLNELQNRITEILPNKVIVSVHNNPFSLVTYICDEMKGRVDAVYIDINLKGYSGIRVAQSILKEYPDIKFIFVSDDIGSARDIFRVNPIYFLTKPYDNDYLRDSLYKLVSMIDEEEVDLLTLGCADSKKGLTTIMTRNIYYIESQKRVVNVHYFDSYGTYYSKLDDIEGKLRSNFVRTHQSYIVNIDKVKKITKDGVLLFGGKTIPISRSRYKAVSEIINRHLNYV
ncbi:MAG: LytTR family DNA-binding domain-containing protein [Lachnospiraceae bacterium]|nr:LytTR family DNA-binding domain-containing protein [Lachnospiraceae bacterium]